MRIGTQSLYRNGRRCRNCCSGRQAHTLRLRRNLQRRPNWNLKGTIKANELKRRFRKASRYAGDARADLPVWQAAGSAIVVEASSSVTATVRRTGRDQTGVPPPVLSEGSAAQPASASMGQKHAGVRFRCCLRAWRATRPHCSPPLLPSWPSISWLPPLTSSTTSVDLADDRRHWSKRERPLASGRLPLAARSSRSAARPGRGLCAGRGSRSIGCPCRRRVSCVHARIFPTAEEGTDFGRVCACKPFHLAARDKGVGASRRAAVTVAIGVLDVPVRVAQPCEAVHRGGRDLSSAAKPRSAAAAISPLICR